MTREDAARKVRLLRATAAPGSGATEPERDTARRLADQLAAAHGLDQPAARRRAGAGFVVDAMGFSYTASFTAEKAFAPEVTEEALRAAVADLLKTYVGKTREDLLRDKQRLFRDLLNGLGP